MTIENQKNGTWKQTFASWKFIVKKVGGTGKEGKIAEYSTVQRDEAIEAVHKEKRLPIILLCKIAFVNRAAFYKWRNRKLSAREELNKELITSIRLINNQMNGIYG